MKLNQIEVQKLSQMLPPQIRFVITAPNVAATISHNLSTTNQKSKWKWKSSLKLNVSTSKKIRNLIRTLNLWSSNPNYVTKRVFMSISREKRAKNGLKMQLLYSNPWLLCHDKETMKEAIPSLWRRIFSSPIPYFTACLPLVKLKSFSLVLGSKSIRCRRKACSIL